MDRTSILSAPVSADVAVGTTLGSFELVGLLGEGAMGRVFRARHVRLGREVAIKVLNPEFVAQPEVVQRFFREARVVNDIDHENIVEVTDFVEAPGLAYLVMELLEGQSLREILKQEGRGYPPIERICGIMAQVCDALEAAHEKGVFHRDLKPDNIFVIERSGGDFVKVLDFGVAKLRDTVDHRETSAGVVLGTPLYMSPEQALGREIDPRADVWSAGVVLFEALAGSTPFAAPSFIELAMCIREQPPKALPRRTPRRERISPELKAIVERCLEKRPEDRFRSMKALGEALRSPARNGAPARRSGFPAAAVAAVLIIGGIALATRLGPKGVDKALGPAWRSFTATAPRPEGLPPAAPAASPPAVSPAPPPPAVSPAVPPIASPRDAAPAEAAPPEAPASQAPSPETSPPEAPSEAQPPQAQSPRPQPSHAQPSHAAPRPAAKPAPARVQTVELTIRSTPSGATVVRTDTGEHLGRTPIHVNVPRKPANVWLKVTFPGHDPVRFAVDLRMDNKANITLHRESRKGTRRR